MKNGSKKKNILISLVTAIGPIFVYKPYVGLCLSQFFECPQQAAIWESRGQDVNEFQSSSCCSWEVGARQSIRFHCLRLLPNRLTSTRCSKAASSSPRPVVGTSHSCIVHDFNCDYIADFLIGKWKIVLCMTQLTRHYCQTGRRRRRTTVGQTVADRSDIRSSQKNVEWKEMGVSLMKCTAKLENLLMSRNVFHCTSHHAK